MLYELWEAVIKLFNAYSWIVSEAKYKNIHGKGIPSMLASLARLYVANISDIKVFDHWNLKILSPKKCFKEYQ